MNFRLPHRFKNIFLFATGCLIIAIGAQYVILPTVDVSGEIKRNLNLSKASWLELTLPDHIVEDQPVRILIRKFSPVDSANAVDLIIRGDDFVSERLIMLNDSDASAIFLLVFPHSGPQLLEISAHTESLVHDTIGEEKLKPDASLTSLNLRILVAASTQHRIILATAIFLPLFMLPLLLRKLWVSQHLIEVNLAKKVEKAELKATEEPQKAKYAWDVARINLEAYFERNRTQVSQVFVIAVIVMSIGFILVCFGVYLAMTRSDTIKPALIAGISGIITQFIGATFMVIYRSTMTQANEFMVILERINTVGMAVQVLDSIPESETALKNESRAKIVELLLSANISTAKAKKNKSPNV